MVSGIEPNSVVSKSSVLEKYHLAGPRKSGFWKTVQGGRDHVSSWTCLNAFLEVRS